MKQICEVKLGFCPNDLKQETNSEDACNLKRHEFNVSVCILLFDECIFLFFRQTKSVREEMTSYLSIADIQNDRYYDVMSRLCKRSSMNLPPSHHQVVSLPVASHRLNCNPVAAKFRGDTSEKRSGKNLLGVVTFNSPQCHHISSTMSALSPLFSRTVMGQLSRSTTTEQVFCFEPLVNRSH